MGEIIGKAKHYLGLALDYSAWVASAIFTIRLFVSFSRFVEEDRLGAMLLFTVALVFEFGKIRLWFKSHGYRGIRRYVYRGVSLFISMFSIIATTGQALRYVSVIGKMESQSRIASGLLDNADAAKSVADEALKSIKGLDKDFLTWKDKNARLALDALAVSDSQYKKAEEAADNAQDYSEVTMFIQMASLIGIPAGDAAVYFWISIAFILEALAYLMTYPYSNRPGILSRIVDFFKPAIAKKPESNPMANSIDVIPVRSTRDFNRSVEEEIARREERKKAEKAAIEAEEIKEEALLEVEKANADRSGVSKRSRYEDQPVSIRSYKIRNRVGGPDDEFDFGGNR
jgi:hypothetical protein